MNKNYWLLVLLIIVILAVGVWLGANWKKGDDNVSPYSAVYLSTGDIYYGELHWFPRPYMEHVWFYQETVDAKNRTVPSVSPFTGAFWKPIDTIYLNPQNIIFWTRLKGDSEIAKVIANPGGLAPIPGVSNRGTSTAP
ncbi:MAG: hypothetical protein UY56_C0009G0004 [Parcubacteria group bacterium GW2011_GWA1_50_14]|uniref:Uncharacterized protein n=1 Tax=Candidatus Liptonbacteria bacterium GWB1_49_6 TaxID=1798644 RepID=A0A1G2C468_9BACT|nr:MAG: hypothetical protein UY56_C0009G0004 [Parcubacteria group bacterium GW2011_GWA1_50_14]OGY96178.1 MAG: hypothetical protein A2122_00100 [Candidatus Liptonbacteria bacterium GWB1_49_6]